ncbi:LysR family transcriptional regulator [Nitratifractor salsuginis]|uniref:Transcriptional regulator, LysR family n=1 Tax=Nitratifractor salsuginis (strain DSM 16511 / JCM 12458 / E9I37-1) TaxID=749222 RepID=E6WZB1_NITSE|nr:LysR family transcriptional regulator [Nitratifractor salsuginis]ADV46623.1 transcriptional regulator, LysR family [Nitratifractor salsuginis DSM 16511]
MLKDFTKLETFLTVVRERSFSRASAKLGISQPAVTQQIKFIENYLDTKVIERKKNGIRLTNAGEELYKVAVQLEKCIHEADADILRIINKKVTFHLGASFTIGNYVIPGECLNTLSEMINNDVKLDVDVSKHIVKGVKDHKIDLGLIEAHITDDDLVIREWREDELVVFSNVPIPKVLRPEDLYEFKWVCREEGSQTRKVVQEVFEDLGVRCKDFNVLSDVSSSTAVLQTVKKSKKDAEHPTVSIISRYAIADEVQEGTLYEARLQGYTMLRKFYIIYHKDNKHNAYVNNTVDFILSGKC